MSRPYRVRELKIEYRPHPSGATTDARVLSKPSDVAAILRPMLENQPQEVFVVALFNARQRLICVHDVARGGIHTTIVDPRIIFRAALLANASYIVLAHNHPSGDPTPSPDDCELTRRLQAGAKLLDLDILDHIIIGDQRYCSFKETGRV